MDTATPPDGDDSTPAAPPTPPERQPWDQQPGESALMYGRFTNARDDLANGAKLVDVAEKLVHAERERGDRRPPGIASLITSAGRWKWVARAEAWRDHHQQQAEAQHTDVRSKAIARQLAFVDKVFERLEAEVSTRDFGEASHTELARWADLAVKIERQALGLDRQLVEVSGPGGKPVEVNLDGLDAEARAQALAEMVAEAQRRAQALARAADDDSDD